MESNALRCAKCGTEASERSLFCGSCGLRIRCKNCGEAWEEGASICVICGVVAGDSSERIRLSNPSNAQRNHLKYEETRTSRAFEADISDAATQNIGGFLAIFLNSGTGRQASRTANVPADSRIIDDPSEVNWDDDAQIVSEPIVPAIALTSPAPVQDRERDDLLKMFLARDETIELKETRLKAASLSDANKRLTYLSLLAFSRLLNKDRVRRSEIVDIIQKAKLYSNNSRKAMTDAIDLFLDDPDLVGLRPRGFELARKFLQDALDNSIAGTWNQATSSTKPSSSGKARDEASSGDGSSPIRRKLSPEPTKVVRGYIDAWKKQTQTGVNHEMVKKFSTVEQAIVAMWAIQIGSPEVKIVSSEHLHSFIEHEFVIKKNERSLRRAMEGDSEHFLKHSSTRFQLNPTGSEQAKRLVRIKK